MEHTQVAVIGAGPAGATLAHFLEKEGVSHIVLDRAQFPRDKVCGDGITVDVLNVLKRIDPALVDDFASRADMLPSWGFCFHAANGRELRYDFSQSGLPYAPFYTARRLHLDHFLVQRHPGKVGSIRTGAAVEKISAVDDGYLINYQQDGAVRELRCRLLVGAEGEKPVVTRNLQVPHFREKQHLIGALRVYYKNVKGLHPDNHLEFYFDKNLLPGYFWVFPLTENQANVGLGMISSEVSRKKLNLKKLLAEVLETHPRIRQMFAGAEPLEKPRGWGLPIITPKRDIAGHGYALIGDAAGMIEPFTGKGIGPGMMSARICSEHLVQALRTGERDLKAYQAHMYRYYASEIRTGYGFQKSLRYPPVLNAVIGLASREPFYGWALRKMQKEWQRWL